MQFMSPPHNGRSHYASAQWEEWWLLSSAFTPTTLRFPLQHHALLLLPFPHHAIVTTGALELPWICTCLSHGYAVGEVNHQSISPWETTPLPN
jgi:hypothetical protein